MEPEKKDDSKPESYKPLTILLLLAFGLWAVWWTIISKWGPQDPAEKGQLGDMFGGVNALFTAFAFAGVIYTILL